MVKPLEIEKGLKNSKFDTFTAILTLILFAKKIASETLCNCPLNNLEHICLRSLLILNPTKSGTGYKVLIYLKK